MTPSPYRTPAPRPPPTQKGEVVSALVSMLIVGGSYAVLLPMAVYSAPLALPALAIPALRAKALNPKSSLMGYLIWVGLSAWAIAYVLDRIDWNGSVGTMLACMAVSASLPVVVAHWSAFRRLRASG
jgi:hypothetical protein